MAKLPAEGTQARRFGKTRSEQATALLEDYAELIADLLAGEGEARPTDIARRFGVSHATAIKTISRLKRAGLATARPYRGVFLTEKGHALADRVRVRHRLVVDLLRALGVPTEAAEADAEGIEHHVSEITLKAFAQFLKARGVMLGPSGPRSPQAALARSGERERSGPSPQRNQACPMSRLKCRKSATADLADSSLAPAGRGRVGGSGLSVRI